MRSRVPPALVLAICVIGILTMPGGIHFAHAATGEVCMADPSTASSTAPCPASAPLFNGPASSSSGSNQLRIGVFIQGSDPLNGFAVIVKSDHTILKPAGVDITGSVVPGPTTTVVECLSNVLVVGSACNPSADNIDTLDLAIAATPGGITGQVTTGLLFTAIYNITGTSTSSGISISFQTDSTCSPSSVSGTPPVCVILGNGSGTPDVETVQAATFNNSNGATMAFVTLSASASIFGPEFPGANSATITATAMSGYPGLATDLVSFTSAATSGLSASLSASSCMTLGASCSVTVNLSTTAAGNYFVIVSGVYATNDPNNNPDTLVGVVRINVVVDDFAFTINPTMITSGSTTATLTSQNGFAGSITLSPGIAIPATPPLTMSFNPNPVTLAAGQTLTSTVTFSAPVTITTPYHATIKATSGARVKTSSTLAITISPGDSTSTLVPSVSCNIALGKTNCTSSVTATVTDTTSTSSVPMGIVTFTLSQGTTGGSLKATTCTLSAGACSVMFNGTSAGSGSIIASYSGDSTHNPSTSSPATVMVTATPKDATSTAASNVSCSIPSGATSCSAAVTATVADITTATNVPNGLVTFALTAGNTGGSLSGTSCTLSLGSCSVTFTATTPGSGSIIATYVGDSTHNSSVSTTATITVAQIILGFSLTPKNANQMFTVVEGSSTDSLNVTGVGGFNGTITFTPHVTLSDGSASASLTASCASVMISKTSPSAISTCSFTSSTAGSYSVVLTGTGGLPSISELGTYTVTVSQVHPTVSTSLSFYSIIVGHSVTDSATLIGATSTASGTVTYEFFTGFTCSGASTLVGTPVTVVNGVVPNSVAQVFNAGGNFSWNAIYHGDVNNTAATSICELLSVQDFNLAASPLSLRVPRYSNDNSTITATPLGGLTGTISLSSIVVGGVSGITATLAFPSISSSGGSRLTVAVDKTVNPGIYKINVTATSSLIIHFVVIIVDVPSPGLILTANPQQLEVLKATSGTTTIAVNGIDGFNGTAAFSVEWLPHGYLYYPDPSLSQSSLTLNVNGQGSVVLSVTVSRNVAAGAYRLNVTLTGDNVSEFVEIFINIPIPDFTITPTPVIVTVPVGVSGSSNFVLAPRNGFADTVSLASKVPSGLQCSLSATSVILGSSGSSTLSCSGAAAGVYQVNITTTGDVQTHVVNVVFTVQDFSIDSAATSIVVNTGSSSNVPLTISDVGGFGFEGAVTLTLSTVSGLNTHINVTSIHVPGTARLTVSSDTPGTYTLTVTGSNGTLSHSVKLTVSVYAPSQVFGLPASETYAIIGAVGVLAMLGLAWGFRRRSYSRRSNKTR